jgi:hypothetical protein
MCTVNDHTPVARARRWRRLYGLALLLGWALTLPASALATTGRASAQAPGTGGVSALAIVIGALGALLALACAAWALARRRAFEPHWWLSMRHSLAEARWRVSGTWAEFADWVRLGH